MFKKNNLIRLLLAADKLCSILSSKTEKHRKRYQVKKAFLRIKEKIQNWKQDFHNKVAKFLCDNYHFILLPVLDTKTLSKKVQRKLRSKTVREKF